jgi:Predicted O-methyltransferase
MREEWENFWRCWTNTTLRPKSSGQVHPKPGAEASVVLIEAVRASKHGLRIEAPLFVLDEDGKETPQLLEAYRTGGE